MRTADPIRVFVGADRSQALAVRVLEHSIRRHTTAAVEVVPMIDLDVPTPRDPRNGQRTGFSYSRFCIPELAGYQGRALYLDADMQVFRDIRELWEIPFDGCKVVIQEALPEDATQPEKTGAPGERIKQCSVMLLDCARLDWDIREIVAAMDRGDYDYAGLMYQLCLLDESEIRYGVPWQWNSLEHWDKSTGLLHYTDMYTQPWVSPDNPLGALWFAEVRAMLRDGSLRIDELEQEIAAGWFRPSLRTDVRWRHLLPRFLHDAFDRRLRRIDKRAGFVKHRAVYAAKKAREESIRRHEAALADPLALGSDHH